MTVTAILLTLLYFLLFNFLIYRFKWLQLSHFKTWVSHALFNAKFAAGILLWAVYTFYYTDTQSSDIHKFYNDALILRNVADEEFSAFAKLMSGSEDESTINYTAGMKNWERNFDEAPINENRTIIRLNAAFMFLSFRTYFVHILFMCFIAFMGWVLLTNAVFTHLKDSATALLSLPVLFLPSVLFWTSGVMKEPLLILGLGLLIQGLMVPKARAVFFVALGIMLILSSKFYVLACVIPAAVAFVLSKYSKTTEGVSARYGLIYLVFLIAAFNVQYIIPPVNPSQMLANKQMHAVKEANYFNAGSRIELPKITTDSRTIISSTPHGIWNCLARPYLWESKNAMMLLSAAEVVVVWVIMVLCFFNANLNPGIEKLNLMYFLLVFSISYFALIGISTPVLGNLVRYKAPLLPLFLFVCILPAQLQHVPPVLRRLLLRSWPR